MSSTSCRPGPLDLGKTLRFDDVTKGLRELNPDINFDITGRHGGVHPMISDLAGVFYRSRHIGSISRGIIPEFDIYDQCIGSVEIPMSEVERYPDDAVVTYMEILPTDKNYHAALLAAERKDDNFHIGKAGKLFRYFAHRIMPVGRKIIRAGWRHTLGRLEGARIHGVTRKTLQDKFKVDLGKYDGRVVPTIVVPRF